MKVTNVKTHFFASGFPITSVCDTPIECAISYPIYDNHGFDPCMFVNGP